MITRENCIKTILQRFPGFSELWKEHIDYWEGKEAGLCNDMAQFSHYVIALINNGKLSELPTIFELIEQFLVTGDIQVQEATATCFLENILNNLSINTNIRVIFDLLGPESHTYAKAWDDFTGVFSFELSKTRSGEPRLDTVEQQTGMHVEANRWDKWKERNPAINIDWIEIPSGEFSLGLSNTQAETLSNNFPPDMGEKRKTILRQMLDRETPQQIVELGTFYISRYPITWKQFYELLQSNHQYSERNAPFGDLDDVKEYIEQGLGNHPVDTTWPFARAFCDWIGARLPTSAEWEKAARGTDGILYPWGNQWDPKRGNFALDRKQWPDKTSPVTAYPSGQSPYGVMDMMGNTYEWTLSTSLGYSGTRVLSENVICRGSSCDFDPDVSNFYNPDWFRNRVTQIMLNSMTFGGSDFTGFRPVLDEWHREIWAVF
jgi:formylglycine-generating enzyme required for sulfatase activity